MTHKQFVRRSILPAALAAFVSLPAWASSAPAVTVGVDVYAPPPGVPAGTMAPVPPNVEAAPIVAAGNQYCFAGPHPVHAGSNPGGATWDASEGRHLHEYPPIDLRLFALQDGCYHFIGDPADFGYRGATFQYYGAHPVHTHHGGGWCFMIGGHAHWWRPWSPHFVVAGPWYYWSGAYDPFFWNYWPYYAYYYRNYYPHYYGGGRYYRNWGRYNARGGWRGGGGDWGGGRGGGARGGWAVAPPIGQVVAPTAAAVPTGARGFAGNGAWTAGSARAGALGATGPSAGTRGGYWSSPRPGLGDGTWGSRAAPMPATSGVGGNFYRPAPAAPMRAPSGIGSGFRTAPSFRAPAPSGSFRSAPSIGGGFGSSFRTAPSVGTGARGIGTGGGWGRR